MAFYQFLAIFPSLAVFLFLGGIPHLVDSMKNALQDFSSQLFPDQVSKLLQSVLDEQRGRALSATQIVFTCAGALWAALNSTWAMIYGLNRAYEVEERRSWWELAMTIAALTLSSAVTACIAIFVIFFSRQFQKGIAPPILEWLVLIAALSSAIAVLYRFAPNLRDHEWRWSTPGAAFALVLWLGSTVLARVYFGRVNDYSRTYGHLNGVAMLLLWLYATNGAILIGGEMNSEIEKASTRRASSPKTSGPPSRSSRE
jgi:membrane protein